LHRLTLEAAAAAAAQGGEGLLQERHNWSIPIAPGVARRHPVGV